MTDMFENPAFPATEEAGETSLLTGAAHRLADALRAETALARVGALPALTKAAQEKAEAFAAFSAACAARAKAEPASPEEEEALRRVRDESDESAIVLEAVCMTLGDIASNIRKALGASTDAGVYHPELPQKRHIRAAQIDRTA